uniref:Uncharacterized protein n=1 Tax=Timema poppense TaxID=170557 RepID=A0A7R9D063_TIMPO|nr:unnamed protein product [Timema poppensis]
MELHKCFCLFTQKMVIQQLKEDKIHITDRSTMLQRPLKAALHRGNSATCYLATKVAYCHVLIPSRWQWVQRQQNRTT